MKEISLEEKAMRYDDRLKRAQKWYVCNTNEGFRSIFEDIFPEFKESRDENIRNGIKILIDRSVEDGSAIAPGFNITKEEAIAWLEKKGEQKLDGTFINVDAVREDFMARVYSILASDPTNDRANQILDAFDCLPISDPTCNVETRDYSSSDPHFFKKKDKAEPKFNVGDWVVSTVTGNVEQIIEMTSDEYICSGTLIVPIVNQHLLKKWTIEDAKEGDVLVTKNKNIFIFKTINGNTVFDYCGLYFGKFWLFSSTVNGSCAPYLPRDYSPATKEQCDLLFQQMKEEGYTWDAEKKELKPLEPNPAWSEEDEKMLNDTFDILSSYYSSTDDVVLCDNIDKAENWLESIKDRVQPKQEWSEEEEEVLLKLTSFIEDWDKIAKGKKSIQECTLWSSDEHLAERLLNFLNSLRPQNTWKPSKEQLEALEHFVRSIGESGYTSPYENNTKLLYSLLEQLKKLKE